MEGKSTGKAIGIDLGTTYCCVGVWRKQHEMVEIIVNEQGNRTTPSMVAFASTERLIGDAAKFQISTNPTNTVFDAKRLIGRRFSDPCVQADIKLWPFTVVEGKDDKPMIQLTYKGEKKLFAAEEISSMLLHKMKAIADQYLKCDIKDAVITVPAYFNDSQKRATRDAGKIAGINVMRIINEPTAAAMTYGFSDAFTGKRTVLVFDLGGGTFDVAVLSVEKGKIAVKAVGGDMHLGGEDFDNRMLNFCVQHFNRKYKVDMCTSAKALRRLRSECERAKRTLSSDVETVIDIDCLYQGNDFFAKIRRAKFEELNADLFERCMEIVKKCLQDADMSKPQIDDIVLVGGSSRIPKVQELLRQFFDRKELCKTVNPDEAVAYGAAVQAAALNDEDVPFMLTDVTPLSLGILVNDDIMKVVVPRNTPIPTRRETSVTTGYDDQTTIVFQVYEGERPLSVHNNLLGEFELKGIQPARRGVPKIEVCFQVSAEGILKVFAQDKQTGTCNEITITNDGGRLNKAEIKRMLGDAQRFLKEDVQMKKKKMAKNNLDSYIYNTKSRVTDAKSKGTVKHSDAEDIIKILNEVEEWLDDSEQAEVGELENQLEQLQFNRLPPFVKNL
ncbi:hypothetical protein KI387_031062 [Taxus chinensis]|uniref:Heat shock protein 70 n=1 Tax=Taxus chinensis TaxID=29808 RepID=A0AA38FEU9_TAXCH|nr:hypothetical protein KI387_031062 [Taxus chinensis]